MDTLQDENIAKSALPEYQNSIEIRLTQCAQLILVCGIADDSIMYRTQIQQSLHKQVDR